MDQCAPSNQCAHASYQAGCAAIVPSLKEVGVEHPTNKLLKAKWITKGNHLALGLLYQHVPYQESKYGAPLTTCFPSSDSTMYPIKINFIN
jgi:hypothetical protein